ncbi:hypothetical protein [Chitinimonas sp.]|uniref:hypothetical protein n=1 Tax=Chitinimonas sp. TaxID=1934313 RepID=UPI0035B04D65
MPATAQTPLRQWAIWSPAMAGVVLLAIGFGGLLTSSWPRQLLGLYAALALPLLWWLSARLGLMLWSDGQSLCWRWGVLRHGRVHRLPLTEIATVEVQTLPDQPRRAVRMLDGVELHGGNFTPKLNRGLLVSCRDGRRYGFGLPEPRRFADALRQQLPSP